MANPQKNRQYKKFNIIQDTREKPDAGWVFPPSCKAVLGVIRRKMRVGDYTVAGLEHVLMIERKSLGDLYKSLGTDARRFLEMWKRTDRLGIPLRYLVIEATFEEVCQRYVFSSLPWQNVLSKLMSLQFNFNVHVVYAGDKVQASMYARRLMEKLSQYNQDGRLGTDGKVITPDNSSSKGQDSEQRLPGWNTRDGID